MTVSPNTIIGSLVWRTREALNRNAAFLDALAGYYYAPNCLVDGKFGFWHFPGRPKFRRYCLNWERS